jgi:hypothetical protein
MKPRNEKIRTKGLTRKKKNIKEERDMESSLAFPLTR